MENEFVVKANIIRFEEKAERETDPVKRETLLKLLAEEKEKLNRHGRGRSTDLLPRQ